MESDQEWWKQYERKQGHRPAKGSRKRTIVFDFSKIDSQGQSYDEWVDLRLTGKMLNRFKHIGQYDAEEMLAQQVIKQYTKVGFPPNSKFDEPSHVSPTYWAVIHITANSKEVVAGYIENDVFYVVFLDKDHEFWPTDIQSRGKNKR